MARRLWTARQIHARCRGIRLRGDEQPAELVQILRAVVGVELKLQYGLADADMPQVRYGGVAIHPDSVGLGGKGAVTQDDLDWPTRVTV
jgi:hypothetical protein